MRLATKKDFRNGKKREARSSRRDPNVWGGEAALVLVGAATMCLNTVQEFTYTSGQVIDHYVWQGDRYYSQQSDRTLFIE